MNHLTDIFKDGLPELQSGNFETRLNHYLTEIGKAYDAVPGSNMPKTHDAEITIKLKFRSGQKPGEALCDSSIEAKIPESNGKGHAKFKKDAMTDLFFINEKTGALSAYPTRQKDAFYADKPEDTTNNVRKIK